MDSTLFIMMFVGLICLSISSLIDGKRIKVLQEKVKKLEKDSYQKGDRVA